MFIKKALILPGVLALAAVACGPSAESTVSIHRSGTGGAQSAAVLGNAPSHVAGCTIACATAADCSSGEGLGDASHFQCTSGRCQWLGCKSKADCTSAYQTDSVICVKEGADLTPACVPTCSVPADCVGSNAAADAASHFQCTSGRCQFLGCQSNAECSKSFQSDKFVCSREAGSEVPQCVLACSAPADCVAPGGEGPDASRFSCENHRCAWLGCRSAAECKTLFKNDKLVCE